MAKFFAYNFLRQTRDHISKHKSPLSYLQQGTSK